MSQETRYADSDGVHIAYVGSGIEFDDRGSHELKEVPGEWRIYAVKE